jgi:hypothetical protein
MVTYCRFSQDRSLYIVNAINTSNRFRQRYSMSPFASKRGLQSFGAKVGRSIAPR